MYGVCSGTDFNTCVLHNAHLPANAVFRKDGVLLHMLNRIFIVCKCAQFYPSTIDLTHALISSLPALNRGLYQAVTSARGVLTRRKKAVLGITLRLAGSQACTITHRRTAEAH